MRFGFLRADFGVDVRKSPATVVVPVGGENFVLIQDARTIRMDIQSGKSSLRVQEITNAAELEREISRIRFAGLSMGNSASRKLIEFLVGTYAMYTQGSGKLFRIKASAGGTALVKAIDTAANASLDIRVFMLRKQEFNVDFRFPQARDTNGTMRSLTDKSPTDATAWLEEVNVIFGPQLNMFFKLAGTSAPQLKQSVAEIIPSHWDELKGLRNTDPRTITVFLARAIQTKDKTHPYGIALRDKTNVILLQDRESADELVKTLAHEFVHTVGDMKGYDIGHPGGHGDLMISYHRFAGVAIAGDLISTLGKQ